MLEESEVGGNRLDGPYRDPLSRVYFERENDIDGRRKCRGLLGELADRRARGEGGGGKDRVSTGTPGDGEEHDKKTRIDTRNGTPEGLGHNRAENGGAVRKPSSNGSSAEGRVHVDFNNYNNRGIR